MNKTMQRETSIKTDLTKTGIQPVEPENETTGKQDPVDKKNLTAGGQISQIIKQEIIKDKQAGISPATLHLDVPGAEPGEEESNSSSLANIY
jgi:hypothetical protein